MSTENRIMKLGNQAAAMSVNALADQPAPSYYTSRYSGEQIDNLLSGLSFEIGGSYANLAAIQAAFPTGDTHAYQAQDTGNIYVWNTTVGAWQSVGQLQGPIGQTGPQGEAAGFGSVTASVTSTVGTPEVIVISSGPNTAKNFSFHFRNIKGDRGERGKNGVAVSASGVYAFNVSEAGDLILSYSGDIAPDFEIKEDGNLYLSC